MQKLQPKNMQNKARMQKNAINAKKHTNVKIHKKQNNPNKSCALCLF